MTRLGYTRYVAQGGDWGAFVVDQMGLQAHNVPVVAGELSMPDEINQLRRRFLGSAAMTHMLKMMAKGAP